MHIEWTITLGNILTFFGGVIALLVALNRHLMALQTIEDSNKRQEQSIRELHSIVIEQMKLNAAMDKRLAILEDRDGRGK